MMEAYLDNSATTRCSDRAFALMQKVLLEDYGNPSSLHMKGVEAERYVKAAREKIAKTLKVTEKGDHLYVRRPRSPITLPFSEQHLQTAERATGSLRLLWNTHRLQIR